MEVKICIVGAGLSGLSAAITLEKAGFSPVIYEESSSAGGRVKTDIVEGYQLDHGFQVLLDAYPKAKEYFDYESLELQRLLPGAVLFTDKGAVTVGDPFRHFPFLLSTLEAGIANLRDLYLLVSLYRDLQYLSDEEIFRREELSTMEFLVQKGFSEKIINSFFKPFFSGIFLEPELQTSSRMFCFVFRMFAKGNAAIPKGGMGALSDQLKNGLKNTVVHYNTPVAEVKEGLMRLKDGREVEADLILIATEPEGLVGNGHIKKVDWHGCDTLYFETETRSIKKHLIGLVAKKGGLINNIFYPTSLATEKKGLKELLSVTIVDRHDLDEEALISRVTEELKSICNIEKPRFIKRYRIRKSLPSLAELNAKWDEARGRVGKKIFICGDHLLYGSSNAALLSGEMAALAMVKNLGAGT